MNIYIYIYIYIIYNIIEHENDCSYRCKHYFQNNYSSHAFQQRNIMATMFANQKDQGVKATLTPLKHPKAKLFLGSYATHPTPLARALHLRHREVMDAVYVITDTHQKDSSTSLLDST